MNFIFNVSENRILVSDQEPNRPVNVKLPYLPMLQFSTCSFGLESYFAVRVDLFC